MHSYLDVFRPSMHDLLWIQVLGMPVAFLVRSIVLIVRSVREPSSRIKHGIRAVSNVCFAASCALFMFSHIIAIICFAVGIGLSIWAFQIAKAQAINNRTPLTPDVKIINALPTRKASRVPARASARAAKS